MSDYQAAVKKAEEAVASMKDPKLKEVAFGKILEHLLSLEKTPASGDSSGAHREKKPTVRQAAAKAGKKQSGIIGWLRELAAEGFFKKPQNSKAILDELASRSHHLRASDLTYQLQQLCHDKVLRRKKLSVAEGKAPVWHWSNW